MKIEIALNTKSINDAIKTIKRQRKILLEKMLPDYINIAAIWITQRANEYIDRADLGSIVKMQIKGGWEYVKIPNGLKIVNRTQKAVFVEFGVGIVGQEHPHPNASEEGYVYNDQTRGHKSSDGTWYFWTNSNELDLPLSAMTDIRGFDDHRGELGKRIIFGTQGAQGVWYLFNALEDFKIEEQERLWKEITKKYWS